MVPCGSVPQELASGKTKNRHVTEAGEVVAEGEGDVEWSLEKDR